MKYKIRSSAILIALVIGIVLSGILAGVVLLLNQYSQSSSQTREGKAAYRAALSGIEDGLLRFKYALAQGKIYSLYSQDKDLPILQNDRNSPDILYDLTFKMDSISIGDRLGSTRADVQRWKDDANEAIAQKAQPFLSDDTVDIDLTYLLNFSSNGLKSIKIYFSNPFVKDASGNYSRQPFLDLSPKPFSAVLVRLIDASKLGEEQLIFEKVNNNLATNEIQISDLSRCKSSGSFSSDVKRCHLQIRPQVAYYQSGVDRAANRFSGENIKPVAGENKYIFFKIAARDNWGRLITATDDKPGTLTIESIGKAGEARRKLQAKIDSSSGKYIGLFDFGIYCGDKCNMPSVHQVK